MSPPKGLAVRLLASMVVLISWAGEAGAEPAWQTLFNGADLDGWEQVGPGRFVLVEGVLRSEGGMGLLWYARQTFADVVLEIEFKLGSEDANSGVFVRIPHPPETPWDAVHGGYEVQIDENGDDHHRTGVLYSLTRARVRPSLEEWNTLRITLAGDRTRVEVNGSLVTDHREGDETPERRHDYEPKRGPRPITGYIGLQNHGAGDEVYFRSIRVRPLIDLP